MDPAEPTLPDRWDVIVVGGGGAGLAAAIEARSRGARVLLLEKNERLGGSTSWSIGSVTATRTPHQRRAGIDDDPAHHWEDMVGFAPALADRDNHALRRMLCEAMPETFDWLLASGIRFFGPMPEPPHRRPRMHNVLPNSTAFAWHLGRRARSTGVRIVCDARVVELVTDAAGAVIGVAAGLPAPAGRRILYAQGGVVLAAGDFTASRDLKAEFISTDAAEVEAVNPTATGDGQMLARRLGAEIVNGDLALGPEIRFIAPARDSLARRLPPWTWLAVFMAWSLDHLPDRLLRPFVMSFLTTALAPSPALFEHGAILVDRYGGRFTDERGDPAPAIARRDGKVAWILLDGTMAAAFRAWPNFVSTAPGVAYAYLPDYRRNRRDVYAEAASIAAPAARLDMPAAALQRSVDGARTTPGGRTDGFARGPYVALGPVRPVFVHNEGGLRVGPDLAVLGRDRRPIPGLYAAGSTGQGGLLLKGHGHHLAWAFASGRIAGRNAAHRAAGG